MTCKKKRFTSEADAIVDYQIGLGNQKKIKPFRAYPCTRCFQDNGDPYWHITVHGFSNELKSDLRKMIREGRARYIEGLEWRVEHSSGSYHVEYRPKDEHVKILGTY
jgi:hypothetical protein